MNVYKQNNSLEVLKKPEGAVGGPKRQGLIYFLNDLKKKVCACGESEILGPVLTPELEVIFNTLFTN